MVDHKSKPHARRPGRKSARAPRRAQADAEIVAQIVAAISSHRLPPGTKLGEQKLGAIFGVSRPRIRQVLLRLQAANLVTLSPNRGAFVARPTPTEAREVFEARRVVEAAIVALLVASLGTSQLAELRAHTKAEDAARDRQDTPELIKLTGSFHVHLAEKAGNAVLCGILRELVARSSLIIALYQAPGTRTCPSHEHRALLDAIEAGNAARAAKLMREHLEHIERALDLASTPERALDLASVFAGAAA
jgi:DNA-binding GntR family transcriptional regulator